MQERQTKQKRIIFDALKALDHPTATEVYRYLHERYPSVSRATVFRVLSSFAESGKAGKLKMAGCDARYDYRIERHYHVRCKRCGKVADIAMTEFPLNEAVTENRGFLIDGFRLEFFGLCPDCRENKASADSQKRK